MTAHPNTTGAADYGALLLRVSLGTPEENAIFADELEAILGEAAA